MTPEGSDSIHKAREAAKAGETQNAVDVLAAIRLDRLTDEEKELLVVLVRAVHLEKRLAAHIREAKEDSDISLVEAAGILMMCREYLSINPDNPKVQKLVSQCRTIISKSRGDGAAPDASVLTAGIAVGYLEDNDSVDLDKFHSLTEEAAEVLSLHNDSLYLNGVTSLSPEAASALARHVETLSLTGLITLPGNVALELANYAGNQLDLDGLTDLTPEAASALAKYHGKLSLNGITSLSLPAIESLTHHVGPKISLDGLEALSDEAAACLARYTGDLTLWGLTSLSLGAAKSLTQHAGSLSLYRLDSPSAEVCEALEAKKTGLSVNTVISPRIRALWDIANQVPPGELLAILWEQEGDPDWDRREKLTKDEHPDIPGGYGGSLERPSMARWDVKKAGDRWSYRVGVMQLDNEFPVAELQVEAQRILDAAPHGIPVEITVEKDQPGTDSECEFFWGEGYQE